MEASIQKDFEKLEEKYENYKKHDFRFTTALTVSVGATLIIIIVGNNIDPNSNNNLIAAFIFAIISGIIIWQLSKRAIYYKPTLAEKGFYRSFKTWQHLRAYLEKGLESDRKAAKSTILKLIRNLDYKWQIIKKAQDREIQEIDYIMNPTVQLLDDLANIMVSQIDENSEHLSDAILFFEKLAYFFHAPNSQRLDEALKLANKIPQAELPPRTKFFDNRPILKHALILGLGSALAGVVTYLIVSPYAKKDDVLEPIGISLGIVGVVVACYLGLPLLQKRQ